MNSISKALRKARVERTRPAESSERSLVPISEWRPVVPPQETPAAPRMERPTEPPHPPTDEPSGALPIEPREYLYLALKHRWLVLAIVVLGTAAALVYTLRQTPEYRTTSVLQLSQERVSVGDGIIQGDWQDPEEFYTTHVRLLQSPAIAERVARRLKLWEHPIWGSGESHGADPPTKTVERYAATVQSMLSPSHVTRTQLVEVRARSESPQLAALVANTTVQEYIRFVTERESGVAQDAASFIQAQIEKIQEQIARNETALDEYATSDSQRSLAVQNVQELSRQLIAAEATSAAARAREQTLSSMDPSVLPEVVADVEIQATRTRLSVLQEEYETLLSRFKSDWPEVQRVEAAIQETESRLDRQMEEAAERAIRRARTEAEEASNRESAFRAALRREEGQIQALDRSLAEYDRRKLELEGQKELLKSLQLRESEAGFRADQRDRRPVNARIVQQAAVPRSPYRPNHRLNLIMGFTASLVLAFGAVASLEMWGRQLVTVEDVRRYVPATYLGMIPQHAPGRLTRSDPRKYLLVSGEAVDLDREVYPEMNEAFKFLRTMLTSVVERSSKTILFTSPNQATGKTFIASNVAVSVAQLGRKVLLIDADFRIPRLHKIFDLGDTAGATNVLLGEARFDESIFRRTDVPGLHVLPAGPPPAKSSELIQSEAMHQLLSRCASMFDFVILDSAPLLPVPDTVDVARYCDETVLVLRSRYTKRQAVDASLDLLQRLGRKVTGVVLNDVDLKDVSTSFHQSYRYGYGGYSYRAAGDRKRPAGALFRGEP